MRNLNFLALCVLFLVVDSSRQGAMAQNPDGFNKEAQLTIGITRKLFKDKTTGAELPQAADQMGLLTAQLFDEAGSGEPAWTEVHEKFVLPSDDSRMSLVLGSTNKFAGANGQPIPFNNSPYILLTLQLNGSEYVTPRMAIAIAGYSHQAGAAYEAVGNLLQKINDYEKRIKTLEYENSEILKKVYREIYGTDPPPLPSEQPPMPQ